MSLNSINILPFKLKLVKTLPQLSILFLLTFISNISEQHYNNLLSQEIKSESVYFYIIIFCLIFTTLLINLLQTASFMVGVEKVLIQNCSSSELNNSFISRGNDFLKESLKAIGKSSLWMYCFIIPGIIRWIEYSILPFVVFLNKKYQSGAAEALQLSQTISKKNKWKLYIFWILFNLVMPFIFSAAAGDYDSFYATPVQATILTLIESIFLWIWFNILWNIYDNGMLKLNEIN